MDKRISKCYTKYVGQSKETAHFLLKKEKIRKSPEILRFQDFLVEISGIEPLTS